MRFEKGNNGVLNVATVDEEFFISILDSKINDTVDSVVIQKAIP